MAAAFRLIDRDDMLPNELSRIDAPVIGIDVERADSLQYFRYPALIQIGSANDCLLIDSLLVDAFAPVNTFVSARDTVVLHAGENDREPLEAKGIILGVCEDTAVAASLLGLPIGLARLLTDLLAVDTPNKNRFQRADWSKRPLSQAMLDYAASDVIHLPDLWALLRQQLEAAGRLAWYHEERDRVHERALTRTRSVKKVRGAGNLSPQEKALLAAVWEARETYAMANDIAPNFLVHDDVLLTLARTPPDTPEALAALLPRREATGPFTPALLDALDQGASRAPVVRDASRIVIDDAVHNALKQARSAVAKEIGLDAGMLAPAGALRQALTLPVDSGEDILVHAGLDGWRTPLLADALWEAYTNATTLAVSVPDLPED